jgi:hypothetical protein
MYFMGVAGVVRKMDFFETGGRLGQTCFPEMREAEQEAK